MQSENSQSNKSSNYTTDNQKKNKSTISIFNQNLNQSSSLSERMDWFKSYREKITHWLNTLVAEQHLTNLCVIAAGNLSDVDYSLLQGTLLSSVVLTDIDLKAMQEGYSCQKLNQASQDPVFTLRALNYLGEESEVLTQNFLRTMRNRPKNPRDSIDVFINQIAQSIATIPTIPTIATIATIPTVSKVLPKVVPTMTTSVTTDIHGENGFDGILVLPIYTQLLFFQLDVELCTTPSWQEHRHYFFSHMAIIIEGFNQWVVSLLKPGGCLLVFSDIIEDQIADNESSEMSSREVEKAIETYEATYGMGLGSYGLLNIVELTSLEEEYFLTWRFNQERMFYVKGVRLSVPSSFISHG